MCLLTQLLVYESLDVLVHVSTLVGDFVIVDIVYHSCDVMFMDYKTWWI